MKMPKPSLSLIITSYNQQPALRLLMASLERQTHRDFEIVIADDGSSDGTAEFVANLKIPSLKWVTQEDRGYRKARIVNEAISYASGEYLLFLDSDVVLEQHCVEDHLRLARPNHFVCGRRVDLGPEFTATLTEDNIRAGFLDGISPELRASADRGDTQNLKRAKRVTHPLLRRLLGYHRPIDLLGSNMSLWKEDLLEINGFNEALESYWGEDGDLFIRLRNSGKIAINGKGMCVQYHLFHPRRTPTPEHVAEVTRRLEDREYKRAVKGYDSRFQRPSNR